MKKLLITFFLFFISHAGVCFANTESASFLKVGIGARPLAMGGAFCAVSDDSNAIQFNPAGLTLINGKEVTATHNEWFEGIRNDLLNYAYKANRYWSFGASLNYMYTNDLIRRNIDGNETGESFGANFGSFAFSLSRRINKNISIGSNLKIIYENIDNKSDKAFATDLGMLYNKKKLSLGIAVHNIGTKIKLFEESFPLPVRFIVGIGYRHSKVFRLCLDADKPLNSDFDIKGGAEYTLAGIFAFRIGLKLMPYRNTGLGISAGLGFIHKDNFKIDYGFLPYGDLGNSHRVSLSIKFDSPQKRLQNKKNNKRIRKR